jgi:hypothetical protein
MWGIFACNELLFERFGMGESVKCDLCNGIASLWHVIGECPGAKAVGIRTAWAVGRHRMYVETRAKRDYRLVSATGIGRGERAEANVEGGGRERSSNVATRYNQKYAC